MFATRVNAVAKFSVADLASDSISLAASMQHTAFMWIETDAIGADS
jgi:hypothetical protein